MNFFKSVWLKLRKSNGMPGPEVLIPMAEQKVPEGTSEEKPKKPRKPRKKKDDNSSNNA